MVVVIGSSVSIVDLEGLLLVESVDASSGETVACVVIVLGSSVVEGAIVDLMFSVCDGIFSAFMVVVSSGSDVPPAVVAGESVPEELKGRSEFKLENIDCSPISLRSLSVCINALYNKDSPNILLVSLGFVENIVRKLFDILLSLEISNSQ